MNVALVHDYLTQRGGAERVVASLVKAFPDAPLYTSLYERAATFPAFAEADVRTLPLDRYPFLRRNHRLALPLLARAFSRLRVEADVAICSSSGWAHGAQVEGRKVVYCHSPARWLYQTERYLGAAAPRVARAALALRRRSLVRWDRRAAASAPRYLVNSTVVRNRVLNLYGIDAEVVPPPPTIDAGGAQSAVNGFDAGFVLCVSRLLPYKNVDAVVEAARTLPDLQVIVAGRGPEEERLRRDAPTNVCVVGAVGDDELRWLYAHCAGLVAASYEDFGLTPLEAASFGRPAAVLRGGGFLDTVREHETGVFFDAPVPRAIAAAIRTLTETPWNDGAIRAHAAGFAEERFVARMRAIVAEESR